MTTTMQETLQEVEAYRSAVGLVRGFEQDTLAGITDEQSLRRLGPTIPPLAWHLAHIAHAEANALLGGCPEFEEVVPAEWNEWYRIGAKLPEAEDGLPPLSIVLPLKHRIHAAVDARLARLKPEDLDVRQPVFDNEETPPPFEPTIRNFLNVLALHEWHHMGEVSVHRRWLGFSGLF